jgi:phage major head subunit gpT-like protein
MGIEKLTSRAVIGEFYKALQQDTGVGWINALSNYFPSDQASEEYAWLGMAPALREWIGGRNAKGFRENGITIKNKHYEATIEVLVRDMRRDKSGQVFARIQELSARTNSHWASLLSILIAAGESTVCYDGQYFFDTVHSEGASGTQDNDITVDISEMPAEKHGTTTAPSVEEMQWAIVKGIQAICSFKDDQGEPMNETATSFLAMVPISFMNVAMQAVETPAQIAASQTALTAAKKKFAIEVVPNVRLSAWTDRFPIFRTDSAVKGLIRQEETAVDLKVKAEGSEFEFDNDSHQYGVDTWRNVGYGYWQDACLVTLI